MIRPILVPVFVLDQKIPFTVVRYCLFKDDESDEENADADAAVIEAPEPVQPVMQPASNIFITNTGYQPAPTQFQSSQTQFQSQQQVSFNKFLESRIWHSGIRIKFRSTSMSHRPLMPTSRDQLVNKDIEHTCMYLIIWFILLLSFLLKYKTSQSNVFVSRVRNNQCSQYYI